MNGLPYYKAYPRDFFEGTIGMSFNLKSAYRLILDLIYMQNGQLPDDAKYISGNLGCSVRAWNVYRQNLIDMGKISADLGIISNFRADKELESLGSFQEKQRQNGLIPKKNNTLLQAMAKPSHKPKSNHTDTDTEEEKEEAKASSKKKASRLPEDWRLPKAWGEFALSEGMSEIAVRREADRFRDYWLSVPTAKGIKSKWEAVWRNWIRKAIDDAASKAPAHAATDKPKPGEVREFPDGWKRYSSLQAWELVNV